MLSAENYEGLFLLTGIIPIITYLYNENIIHGIAIAVILQVILAVLAHKAKDTPGEGDVVLFYPFMVAVVGTLLLGIGGVMKYHDYTYLAYALPVGITAALFPVITGIGSSIIIDGINVNFV